MPEKVSIFIDASNMAYALNALQIRIDWKRLLELFNTNGSYLVSARYYTAVDEQDGIQNLRPLLDWMNYNGYNVIEKPAVSFIQSDGKRKVKGNVDVELTLDVISLCDKVDRVVLFTGDGDFVPLVRAVLNKGVRVDVCSTRQCEPSMVSSDLRKACSTFIDLNDIRQQISASVAEQADARDLKSLDLGRAGSSPAARTKRFR